MGSKAGSIRKPDFFIVGAPKCGTTSMAAYLRQHPDIFMARGEPHYFGSDIQFNPSRMSEQKYLNFFSEARNEKRVGEKSTWYLYSKRAAIEIKKFCPYAKIIIQIRNPVDMLYSLHNHFVYHAGREDIRGFEAALDAEQDRRKGLRIPKHARFPEHLFYSDIPRYTDQIKRYINLFGNNSVDIIIFDDFIKNTAEVYKEVLRFLRVDDEFSPQFKIFGPSRSLKITAVRDIMSDSWMTKIVKSVLPCNTRRLIGQAVSRWNSTDKPRPPIGEHLRKRLQEEFTPEVERLSELLGRDLTYWCKR